MSRPVVAALILLLVVPLLLTQPVLAQDDEVPIVPVAPGLAPLDDPAAAPVVSDAAVLASQDEPVVVDVPLPEPVAVEPVPAEPVVAEPVAAEPVVADVVPPAAPVAAEPAPLVDPDWSPPTTVYVPETGQSIDGVFLDLWRGWGGANAFGYPITPEFEEDGHVVQYYGYARLEYWPEDPDGNVVHLGELGRGMRPYIVRRGSLADGTALDAALAARAWLPLDPNEVEPDGDAWRFFPETEHGVAGAFKAFWEATGAEDFLGLPLSEEYVAGGITYQVFERGKVAQEQGGDPYLLPAGELVAARYRLDTSPVGQGDLPNYSEDLFVPPPPPPTPEPTIPEPTTPVPADAVPLAPQLDPNAERWIEISIGQQYLWARQGNTVLWEGFISTGRAGFDTPPGSYSVLSKLESQTMEGVLGGEYYNVPDVPSVMYFTDRGHAIHGTYWHANFGAPMSHGCVNLPMETAAVLYAWAPVGTRVEILS